PAGRCPVASQAPSAPRGLRLPPRRTRSGHPRSARGTRRRASVRGRPRRAHEVARPPAPRYATRSSQLELHSSAGSAARLDAQLSSERLGAVLHRDEAEAAARLFLVEAGPVVLHSEPHTGIGAL